MSILINGMKPLLPVREQQPQEEHEQSYGGLTDRTQSKQSSSLPASLNSSINLGILKYKERFIEEQTQMQIKVRNVFNHIGDLNDKKQIQTAMKQLATKEERSILIDKILKRKQEKQDADEIMRMSKVQPLLTRFVRKLKKQSLAFQESKSHLKEHTNEKNVHFGESSAPDSRRSSINSQDESQSQRSETIRTPLKKNSEASELENRAKFLSIFLNNKKKKEEPKEEKLNSISSVCELLMGKTDNLGKKINLNKVSEDSSDLINRGKELQKLKANELLRDGQKLILASHFKSYSLRNRYNSNIFKQWTDDPNINTFHAQLNDHDHKLEQLKMKNFHNYQNLLDATKVVESDINAFLVNKKQEKGNSALDFVMLPSSIKDPTTRVIENGVRQMQVYPLKKEKNRTLSVNNQDKRNNQLGTKSHSRSVSSLKLQQERGAPPVSLAFILDNSQTPTTATNQHDLHLKAHDLQNILNSSICQSTANQPYEVKDKSNQIIPAPFLSNRPTTRNHSIYINNNLPIKTNSSHSPILLRPLPTPIVVSETQAELLNMNNQTPQRQRLPSKSTKKSNILLINNGSFTEKMQDMISAVRSENNNNTIIKDPHQNNLDNNTHGSTTERTHRRNPSSLLAPLTAHAQRNSSCVSFNFNYDFDKACQDQRDKTGVQKKQYFSYNRENQDKVESQSNNLFSKSRQENADINTYNDIGSKLSAQNTKQDFMRTLENNKLLNHALKNIKTVDKWKLQGDIKYQGAEDPEIMNDEEKDDESLVSFTEIKLDKMYKKTIALNNNQRIIKKQEEQSKGRVDAVLSASHVKTMNHLSQLKRQHELSFLWVLTYYNTQDQFNYQ